MPRSIAPPDPLRPPLLRVSAGLATAVLLAATAAGCTGDDDEPKEGGTTSDAQQTSASMQVAVTRVAGTLKGSARTALSGKVAPLLQEYVDNALLGDYPRADFAQAFSTFTKGAAKQAAGDADLLTGADFATAESVRAKKLTAKLSVFAPGGKVAGATARIHFVLDVDGAEVTVAGRLLLTPQRGTWRIFGYDVHRSDLAGTAATEGEG